MFSFDVTLIVQMIHFFLAWWFIDRFLFKKLVHEIHQEDSFTKGLERKLHDETAILTSADQHKKAEWAQFKELYKQTIPVSNPPYTSTQDIHFRALVDISPEEKELLRNEISAELVRRVVND